MSEKEMGHLIVTMKPGWDLRMGDVTLSLIETNHGMRQPRPTRISIRAPKDLRIERVQREAHAEEID